MGFNSPDRLLNAGISAETTQALQDQVTGLGALATQPSGGGSSINPQGNCFTFASVAGVGNGADTTEDTLKTFTLPANALDVVGRGVYVYAWGKYAANANTKAAKLYFGTTSIAAATGNGSNWSLEMYVLKAGASTQVISMQNITSTTHGGVTNVTNSAATDTAAITIKVTGQDSTSANANAILLNGMIVTFMN